MERAVTVRVGVDVAGSAYVGALAAYLSGLSGFVVVDDLTGEAAHTDLRLVVTTRIADSDGEPTDAIDGSAAIVAIGRPDTDAMLTALEAGASGYIEEGTSFDEAAAALEMVASGHVAIPPTMLGRLLRHVIERRRAEQLEREKLNGLTDREREVFELMALGFANDAVGDRLYISPATVRTHVQRVFRKLDVHTRAEAVALAARCGLSVRAGEER